jgi:hypothetical protein
MTMASFVLTFRSTNDHVATEAEGAAWGRWFEELGAAIVEIGSRVGATSGVGAAPTGTVVSGFTVIRADSLEAAVLLAKGCPGLEHGGAVEVGELVAM